MEQKRIIPAIFWYGLMGFGLAFMGSVAVAAEDISGPFQVPARGMKTYALEVPAGAGRLTVGITDQTRHVNLEVLRPGADKAACQTSTWSYTMTSPLSCSITNPEPGLWAVRVTGAVHVGNVDKYPVVAGTVFARVAQGQVAFVGLDQAAQPAVSAGGRDVRHFRLPSRGSKTERVHVPPGVRKISFRVQDHIRHVSLEVFQPGAEKVSCQSTTWSYKMDSPLTCTFDKPVSGAWTVRITGAVHVGNVKKYPEVAGNLVILMEGGSDAAGSRPSVSGEAPLGHLPVEVPSVPTPVPHAREAPVPEAGTWFPSAATLEYDSRFRGYIKKGDYDMVRFYFPGGQLKAYSQGSLDLVADLMNSKEERLARDRSSGGGGNFMFSGTYPPGLYYIQIRVMYHGGEGPYELVLGNGRDWSFVEER